MARLTDNTPSLFELVQRSDWDCDRFVYFEADVGAVWVNGVRLTKGQVEKLIDWLESAHEKMPRKKEK